MRQVACWTVGCTLALLLAGHPAGAADISWQVHLGLGDTCREGSWTPLFIDITNNGPAQSGAVVVPINQQVSPSRRPTSAPFTRQATYTIPVDLPQNSLKQYVMYLPRLDFDHVYLVLGRTRLSLARPHSYSASATDCVVAVMGGEPGLLQALSGATYPAAMDPIGVWPRRPSAANIAVTHCGWDRVPDAWLGYDGADIVVLGDATADQAPQQALKALRQWVQLGGTLVVPGGSVATALSSSLKDLLPLKPGGYATLSDLKPLTAWVHWSLPAQPVLVATGTLNPGAQVLCGSADQPLVVSRAAGAGQVIMTTFDFTGQPFKYWDGQRALWQRLLQGVKPPLTSPSSNVYRAYRPYSYGNSPADLVTQAPEARMPPMWLILGFLAAYLIILVPVQYFVLKSMDRRELAWLVTPVVVALFTVGAYGVGYAIRGGRLIYTRLALVETAPGATIGRGDGYVGIFSPVRRSYRLTLGNAAAAASDSGENSTGRATFVQGSQEEIRDASVDMWASRAFEVPFMADLGGGVRVAAVYDGRRLRVEVTNQTPWSLTRARIEAGGREGPKLDIPAGHTAKLSWTASSTPMSWGSPPYYGSPSAHHAPGLDQVLEQTMTYAAWERSGAGGVFFIAAVRSPLVPANEPGRGCKTRDLGVLTMPIPIHLAHGHGLAVPAGLMTCRLIGYSGSSLQTRTSGGGPVTTMDKGDLVFQYQLPAGGQELKATSLRLTYGGSVSSSPYSGSYPGGPPATGPMPPYSGVYGPGGRLATGPAPPRVYIRNVRTGAWQPMRGSAYNWTVQTPDDYVSAEGQVTFKLASPKGQASFKPLQLRITVNN